jgi:hypothetical protein
MKILFNYAHNRFLKSQEHCTNTAYEVGGFDKVFQFRIDDIDIDFRNKNSFILNQSRGAGYWLWKYYFAIKLLNDDSIKENDYIFYADSGSHFIDKIDPLIETMDKDNQSVMTFRGNHLSYVWTKRDMFLLMDADEPKYTHTCQRGGGWFLFKKNEFSRKFFTECLKYSCDYRIITDSQNELGLPNYPGFRDHRHDESLITIMAKKYDLFPYRSPSQHGFTDDVNFTNNRYDEIGYNNMVEKFGPISTWLNKYGCYFHGESLKHYPEIIIDDKSTYPTILELTRNPN